MPDLVTHACTGFLVKAATRGDLVAAFVAGSVLPDLLSRAPVELLLLVDTHLFPVPEMLIYIWAPTHLPTGMVLWSMAFSFLYAESRRKRAFLNLLAGALLHLVLDLLQSHQGLGYFVFFPFYDKPMELGLLGTESTVWLAPPLVLLTWMVWRRRRHEKAPRAA